MFLTAHLTRWIAAFVWLLALTSTPLTHAREIVSVNRNEINMRSGPGTQHSVLWALSQGYPLQVTKRQGQWLHVRDFERDTGWVYAPLVSRKPYVIVNTRIANVRQSPTLQARIVTSAAHGEVLRMLGRKQRWIHIQRSNGTKGWISQKLLWGW